MISLSDRIENTMGKGKNTMGKGENTVGKGENVTYQNFLLFPACFQTASFSG